MKWEVFTNAVPNGLWHSRDHNFWPEKALYVDKLLHRSEVQRLWLKIFKSLDKKTLPDWPDCKPLRGYPMNFGSYQETDPVN